jgi:hypothetical protein
MSAEVILEFMLGIHPNPGAMQKKIVVLWKKMFLT